MNGESRTVACRIVEAWVALLLMFICSAVCLAQVRGATKGAKPVTDSAISGSELEAAVEAIRKKHDLPALAVGVIENGMVTHTAAVGVRKYGDGTPVTVADKFHIGVLHEVHDGDAAARLVDRGKIRWVRRSGRFSLN